MFRKIFGGIIVLEIKGTVQWRAHGNGHLKIAVLPLLGVKLGIEHVLLLRKLHLQDVHRVVNGKTRLVGYSTSKQLRNSVSLLVSV